MTVLAPGSGNIYNVVSSLTQDLKTAGTKVRSYFESAIPGAAAVTADPRRRVGGAETMRPAEATGYPYGTVGAPLTRRTEHPWSAPSSRRRSMPWPPTAEQQRIIDHDPSRHARILAGPGTGKSATVIRLMLRLGDEGKHGRLLTFTRAATNELKEKVAEHPEVLEDPSTVHSFAIATLLANPGSSGLPEPIRIADDWEWKELIREHLADIIDTTVRLVDQACAEMASNWESLEENEDPNLPGSSSLTSEATRAVAAQPRVLRPLFGA